MVLRRRFCTCPFSRGASAVYAVETSFLLVSAPQGTARKPGAPSARSAGVRWLCIGFPDTRCQSIAFPCDSVMHNTVVGDLKRYHFYFGPPDSSLSPALRIAWRSTTWLAILPGVVDNITRIYYLNAI